MTGPADEELLDVVQRERKDYRNDLIAADTAEVEDQAERISRALRSASKSAVESSPGSPPGSASGSAWSGASAGQPRPDEPTGSGD